MDPVNFCYWLQGFFEIKDAGGETTTAGLSGTQTKCIRQHLNLVFKHAIDPSLGSEEHVAELRKIHTERVNPDAEIGDYPEPPPEYKPPRLPVGVEAMC
jgi:hypothetical protein